MIQSSSGCSCAYTRTASTISATDEHGRTRGPDRLQPAEHRMGVSVAERRHQEAACEIDFRGFGPVRGEPDGVLPHARDDAVNDQKSVGARLGWPCPHGSVAKQRRRHRLGHYAGLRRSQPANDTHPRSGMAPNRDRGKRTPIRTLDRRHRQRRRGAHSCLCAVCQEPCHAVRGGHPAGRSCTHPLRR